jgi:folate-binding protein YgfZ
MAESAFFCPLTHEGVLAVRGTDAGTFLQGQLTCNIQYLAGRASLGARCTPKGRMQSSFRILPQGDGFLMAMAGELVEPQLADLKKYAVFSRGTQLADESAQWARFGLRNGDAALAALGLNLPAEANALLEADGMLAVRLSDGRAELWAPAEHATRVQASLAAQLPEAPLNDWLLAQVRAGVGQVFGATRELFIPQMINLQALDGVSFRKGCYAGQEIVARMQYLGRLKRRMHHLAVSVETVPEPGTELFSPVHGSSVGEVVLAARAAGQIEVLAVVQQDALEDGRLHLENTQGPALQPLDLPYGLDSEREIQR